MLKAGTARAALLLGVGFGNKGHVHLLLRRLTFISQSLIRSLGSIFYLLARRLVFIGRSLVRGLGHNKLRSTGFSPSSDV